jgi:hypothetical protein
MAIGYDKAYIADWEYVLRGGQSPLLRMRRSCRASSWTTCWPDFNGKAPGPRGFWHLLGTCDRQVELPRLPANELSKMAPPGV